MRIMTNVWGLSVRTRTAVSDVDLPPGQRLIEGFPRFGTHMHRPPPNVPASHRIEIRGAVDEPFEVTMAQFADLPRVKRIADFHCVAGWTATGLQWEGVAFATFFEKVVAPHVTSGTTITHLVFGALDGYRVVACIDDAMAYDVLIADHLDGQPLPPDHGAPLRLVSPSQYGYISAKHLSLIELHLDEPDENFGAATTLARLSFRLPIFRRHPRSRVWHEERHRYLPTPVIRPIYSSLVPIIRRLSRPRPPR